MSSWGQAGSQDSTPWRHDDRQALPRSGAGDQQASQPFPVPNVTAAIAAYLASQSQSQPPKPLTCTSKPPVAVGNDTSQPSPPQHSFAGAHLRLWPPRHRHHATTASPWPWTPTFAPPPPPSIPTWAVPFGGVIPDASSGGGTFMPGETARGDEGIGCLRVTRRAGRKAAGESRNFALSPLSLHAALALVAAGTGGETRRELLGFLGSASLDALRRAPTTELVGELRGLPQTSFACGVWVDRRWALRPEFAEAAGAVYAAVAEPADFVSQTVQARQRVNAFVSDATQGLIPAVLPPGSVDASTVVVLANALYFRGAWAQPFDPSRTVHAPFHLPDGVSTVCVPFMTSSFEQQVATFPGFRALKLPYSFQNGDHWHQQAAWFYMLVLLPDDKDLDIAGLYDEAESTPGFIKTHTPAAKVPVGRFMVPKFKFAFGFEASEDMQKLGVTRAFRGGDFSGMVDGGDGLSITGVYHKSTVEVDEAGTVAAAATAMSICLCGSASPPVDFVADRPFLFAVVEEKSGAVLFFGHVVNPLAEG